MKSGSVKIIDRLSAVEAIKRLNKDDLLFLNRLIVERLKLISQAKSTMLMAGEIGSAFSPPMVGCWKGSCCV
jgi:hypothetical protein